MAITGYSGFWGGSNAYAPLCNKSHVRMKVFQLLRKASVLPIRALDVALIAASGSTTGSNTRKRVEYTDGQAGQLGGARTFTNTAITSVAANVSILNDVGTIKTRASAPRDTSGNGGPALT